MNVEKRRQLLRIGVPVAAALLLLLALFALAGAGSARAQIGALVNFAGEATSAAPVAFQAPAAAQPIVINEIRTDQTGTDYDEYFELSGPPGASLDGLTYLVIGDGAGGSGVIESVTPLTGSVVPTDGVFLAAKDNNTLGAPADLITTSLNFENSDNVTHLLVQGFTGSNAQDLDTNDDGVLDLTPWTQLVDLIALIKEQNPPTTTEYHYGPPTVGPDGTFVPGHVYFCETGWQIGPFDPAVGKDTPGLPNSFCPLMNDMSVTKIGPAYAPIGDQLVYTITLRNAAAITATDIILTDTLPVSATYVSDTSGLTPTNPSPGVYVWDFGDFGGGSSRIFNLTISTDPSIANSTVLTNTALISTGLLNDNPLNNVSQWATGLYTDIAIHTLQGAGHVSPFVGVQVRGIGGIVTDLHYGSSGQVDGFFMQDPAADADPLTSEGIFVFTSSAPPVGVGEQVTVTGVVDEYYEMTEIKNVTSIFTSTTSDTITPLVLDLPAPIGGDLEPYEGMLVTIPETLTASQNYFQGRYGQVTLSSDGRLYNPTNGNGLGDTFELDLRRMLVLDDNTSTQNPDPIPYIGQENTLRAGDTVSGLTGIIDDGLISSGSLIHYRLQPVAPLSFTRVNQRTTAPETVGGNVQVASFNVLNYFNGDGQGGGFPTSRGASTPEEFVRQRTKIITALVAIDADVVGLMEIENDGDGALSAIQDLVNGLNEATAPGTYAFVSEPAPGADEIKVAMIYKPGRVTPVGPALNYQTSTAVYDPLFDRPPLAQTFQVNSNGALFTVVVNHFKSKGSCPLSGPDADQGDGQGCWNAKRIAQAQGMLDLTLQLQSSSGDDDIIVIGDLNSYGEEDPILTLTAGGLVNQVAAYVQAAERYSYVFDGLAGYLDHGLTTPSLSPQINNVTIWHINTDEPSVIDYNTEFKPQDLYTPTPYRSSDHDPVILGLNLSVPQVTFVYHDLEDVVHSGESVNVAGSFNGWNTTAQTLTPNADYSVFSTTLVLTATGGIDYKYIVYTGTLGVDPQWDWLNTNNRTATIALGPNLLQDYRNVSVGYAVLQWPPAITVTLGQPSPDIYGQVYISNVTNPVGVGRGVKAELGYGASTDLDAWKWAPMSFNTQVGNNDEYVASLTPSASGVYSYAVRFDGNWGVGNPNAMWAYGDKDGVSPTDPFELSQAGVLTVLAPELSIVKSAVPDMDLLPGGTVTFTISLSNTGQGVALGVALTDTLPAELSFGAWIAQHNAVVDNGVITWNGDLAAHESFTLIFTAVIADDPDLYNQTFSNRVAFTSLNSGSGSAQVDLVFQSQRRIYLPLISKNPAP